MCVCVRKKRPNWGEERGGSLPVSYTAVSLGGAWLLQASELGFFLLAVESGSHCKLSGL